MVLRVSTLKVRVKLSESIVVYHVSLAFQCTYGCSDERGENGDGEEGRDWILPDLLYTDDRKTQGQ